MLAPDRSGHCVTPIASSRSEWAMPGLNQEEEEEELRSRFFQSCPLLLFPARKICQKDVPERMSEYIFIYIYIYWVDPNTYNSQKTNFLHKLRKLFFIAPSVTLFVL